MNNRLGILYGSAYLGIALVTYVVGTWVTYFYAPPPDSGLTPLLPAGLAGMAFAVGRIVDAVADPIVGVWSDRHRGHHGRRIPFMRASALPLAVTFALIWFASPDMTTTASFLYLAVLASLFFTSFTLYVAPYLALLPELAVSQRHRVNLATWQAAFNIVGLAAGGLGAGILIAGFGFRFMGLVLAVIALLSFFVPAFTVRERFMSKDATETPGLWKSVGLTLQNRAFRYYVGGQFFFWLALNMVMLGTPYLVTVVMRGTEMDAALALGVSLLIALASFPLLTRWSARNGLRWTLMTSMVAFAVVLVLWFFTGLEVLASSYVQGLILFALAGLPLSALFVLPNALVAEITDYDQQLTGQRREAVYFGVQGLIVKSAMGAAAVVSTQVMEQLGYSPQAPAGVLWLGPVAAVFVLAGLLTFAKYPQLQPQVPGSQND